MMHSTPEAAGMPSRGRRRSKERPWTSGRVLMFMVLSFGTLASALTYTVLHRNQRCLTRQRTAMAASGRGPKRRHWRRSNLEAELRFRQQCTCAFGGIAGKQPEKLGTVAIVGACQAEHTRSYLFGANSLDTIQCSCKAQYAALSS